MSKKKSTKTEARPKKQRTPTSRSTATPRPGAPKKPAAGPKAPKAKAPPRGEEKPAKPRAPLAKVRAGAKNDRPSLSSRDGVQAPKPAKPLRRIPNAELNKIRTLLSQKKIALTNHLQTELSELEKPEKRHRTDLEEIASDTHDTDSLCEIMDIEASQIGQIDMALTKIDNGTYGICEDCGGEIPLTRLEALPFATQCVDCKRKAEIEGRISAER